MNTTGKHSKSRLGWIMAVYLLGIFMGAIDTGIVSPARTVIQGILGVDGTAGIWMITIYTLAYAAIIPISGKLADRMGRKYVYVASVALFGIGSLICGLSNASGSFPMLLVGRVVQALGGGGIMPVATAEFGTSFPPEKRGMALGLVGGTYGVANILGSTIGSAILNAFGNQNWQMLFYINLPICAFIIAGGLIVLPSRRAASVKRIDSVGTLLLVAMTLSLLYGLKNLDFFNFAESIRSTDVYPFIIAFAVLLPFFLLAERRAGDPILALGYFTRGATLIPMALSFLVGIAMMGMVFVPQFSENALRIATGSGGYFTAILGVFAGIAAPLSGVLIDRMGPKKVLFGGFAITLGGAVFLSLVAVPIGGWLAVILSLVLIGLGLGFTMGTPLNYMMLAGTRQEDSNSALAALSLIRSIGTAIAPAIMVGFLAQAGTAAQDTLMNLLPKVQAPTIPLAEKVQTDFAALKSDAAFAKMLGGADLPEISASSSMDIDMSGGTLPQNLLESLQNADTTNITERVKDMAVYMYGVNTPSVIVKIQDGIQTGLDQFAAGLNELDSQIGEMNKGVAGAQSGIDGISQGIAGADKGIAQLKNAIAGLDASIASARAKGTPETGLAPLQAQKSQMETALTGAQAKRDEMATGLATAQKQLAGLQTALDAMNAGRVKLVTFQNELQELKDSIPGVFEQAKQSYLATLDAMAPKIESTFQGGLNGGFKNMFLLVAAASVLSVFVLAFYKQPDESMDSAGGRLPDTTPETENI